VIGYADEFRLHWRREQGRSLHAAWALRETVEQRCLLSLPMLEEQDITDAYSAIFGREFPLMNRFYESDILA
jgi:hypothetical protein